MHSISNQNPCPFTEPLPLPFILRCLRMAL
jgi:hypothetical protein